MATDLQPLDYIRQSNLIESVDDPKEDQQSLLAWQYLMPQPKLTMEVVLKTHWFIMRYQLDKYETGVMRRIPVTIDSKAAPAPWMVEPLLSNWVLDMQNYRHKDPKAMHVRFEQVHPFTDGNGRTGRMLMWWHESHTGKDLTYILEAEKWKYYRWFKQRDV